MHKTEDCNRCRTIKASRNLTFWANKISEYIKLGDIIELLDGIFNRGLLDDDHDESVNLSDDLAFRKINEALVKSYAPVDEIAEALLQRRLYAVFHSFVDFVIERRQSDELGLLLILLNAKGLEYLNDKVRKYSLALIHRAITEEDKADEYLSEEVKKRVDDIFS